MPSKKSPAKQRQPGAWSNSTVGREQRRVLMEQIREIENSCKSYNREDSVIKPKEVKAAEAIVAAWESKVNKELKAHQTRIEKLCVKARRSVLFSRDADDAQKYVDALDQQINGAGL